MKRILIGLIALVIVGASAYFGRYYLINLKSNSVAQNAVQNTIDAKFTDVYNALDASTKSKYKNSDDFIGVFGSRIFIEESNEPVLVSKTKSKDAIDYNYKLVRKDDPLKGYRIDVFVKQKLAGVAITDVTFQEDAFATAQ